MTGLKFGFDEDYSDLDVATAVMAILGLIITVFSVYYFTNSISEVVVIEMISNNGDRNRIENICCRPN